MPMRHEVRRTSFATAFSIPSALSAIAVDAEQSSADCDIPFLMRPLPVVPPFAGTSPGSAGYSDRAVHSGESDPGGHAIDRANGCFQSRSINSKRAVPLSFDVPEVRAKVFDFKSITRVDICRFRRSHIAFTDDSRKPRQCQFQLLGLRSQGHK